MHLQEVKVVESDQGTQDNEDLKTLKKFPALGQISVSLAKVGLDYFWLPFEFG